MKKRVEEIRKEGARSIRCSALFDSDALYPGTISPKSKALEDACEPDVHHHRLERRYSESYLPLATLQRWARSSRSKEREPKVEAFAELTDEQRYYFNMKDGLQGDAKRPEFQKDRGAKAFHDSLQESDQNVREKLRGKLQGGFDRDISKLFRGQVRESDFRSLKETEGLREIRRFVDEIIERIR